MSMMKRGPRDWSPRPGPTLEDLQEAEKIWDEMETEIKGLLSRVSDISHYVYKARKWMEGEGEFRWDEALEFSVGASSIGERIKNLAIETEEAIKVTYEISRLLVKVKKVRGKE
jgi:hypothetical protein